MNEINRHRRQMGLPEHNDPQGPGRAPSDKATFTYALHGLVPLSKDTVFPSARALLEAGISCREVGKTGRDSWAVYWMEGGAELTLFPGGEGPQEMDDVDAVIDAIGGDQPAILTRASLKRFGANDGYRKETI